MRAFFDTAKGTFWWAVGDGEVAYPATVNEVSGWPSEAHVYDGSGWVLPQEPPMTEEQARAQRDAMLAETDWIVARAYEEGKPVPPQWVSYRMALRDVPQQAGFPANTQWPTKPE